MPDTSAVAEPIQGEAVGRFRMTVARGESTPETDALWNQRANALARWLASEWHREQKERKTA